MILDLHRQGLSVAAIARRVGLDRKTVRKYIDRGLEPPVYGPRTPRPRLLEPFEPYLLGRVTAYPELTASRLLREIRERGYGGGYTAVKDYLRDVRPAAAPSAFERRFETPPGRQAQVDFARFEVVFTDEPGAVRIVWLFALVLGHSRYLWAADRGPNPDRPSPTRTCRPCSAATPPPSRRSAASPPRSCTIG